MKRQNEKAQQRQEQEFIKAFESAKAALSDRPVSIVRTGESLMLQFSTHLNYDGTHSEKPIRSKYSLAALLGTTQFKAIASNCPIALEKALEISKRLETGTFDWGDYWQIIPKSKLPDRYKSIQKVEKIAQILENYKDYYWATHDKNKHSAHEAWAKNRANFHKYLPKEKCLSDEIIEFTIAQYPVNTKSRIDCIKELKRLCDFIDYSYTHWDKWKSSYKSIRKVELSDFEILDKASLFQEYVGAREDEKDIWILYKWMYGMIAVYGLRNQEVFNIQNLDKPFKIRNTDIILPPFIDSNNKVKAIFTYGKTGERVQPFPHPIEWIEQFNLTALPKFPQWSDDPQESTKQKYQLSKNFGNYLRRHEFGFTAYALRHCWIQRTSRDNVLHVVDAANYGGHSPEVHMKVYHAGVSFRSKLERAKQARERMGNERSELEGLKAENEALKAENEILKLKLQLIQQERSGQI